MYWNIKQINESGFLDDNEEFYDYETAEVDGSNIFDETKAEAPYYREFLHDDSLIYQQKNHNKTGSIVYMTPRQYFDECARRFGVTFEKLVSEREADNKVVEHLKQVILKYHRRFPIPMIDYTSSKGQEGLHRMLVAAELFGWDDNKYPVLIIDFYDKEKARKDEEEKVRLDIWKHIRIAVKETLTYRLRNYDDFIEQLEWELNKSFEYTDYVPEDHPDEISFDIKDDEDNYIITVLGVDYRLNKEFINYVDDDTSNLFDDDVDDYIENMSDEEIERSLADLLIR